MRKPVFNKDISKIPLILTLMVFLLFSKKCFAVDVNKTETIKNKTPILRDNYKSETIIEVADIKYFYKPDSEIYYREIKDAAAENHKTSFEYNELAVFYKKAYNQADGYAEFSEWNENTQITPLIFDAVVSIVNKEKQAVFNTKVQIEIRAKSGLLKPDSASLTTDYDYLTKTAVWKKWKEYNLEIPVLGQNEIKELKIEQLCLADLFKKNVNLWPESIQIRVKVFPEKGYTKGVYQKTSTLNIIPDQFQAQKYLY